jgi:crotonobetainyl-CoA:carnitine CoA-transferase CaiB-like acyl-CoA transferase
MKALEGFKVLELAGSPVAAFCAMLLADFGAEVFKIGAPPEVAGRQLALRGDAVSEAERRREAAYYPLDRNKKSIGFNLKSEQGRRIFYRMAETADVIVEGFRPGVAKRMGVDYETVSSVNPGIVYCSITPYGQTGPYHALPAHEICLLSMSGALSLFGERGGRPIVPINLVGDWAGGALHSVIGILMALIAREKNGKGQQVDISMTDGVISLLTRFASYYFSTGVVPKRGETFFSGAYPYHSFYETKDGKFISIACAEPVYWEKLCHELGREDLTHYHFTPDHFFRQREPDKWEKIFSQLNQAFLTKTRDEWFDLLQQKNLPVAKVYGLDEVFNDPHILHRQMLVELYHPSLGKVKQVGIPIKLSATPGEVRSTSPLLGQHTEEVLLSLGYLS